MAEVSSGRTATPDKMPGARHDGRTGTLLSILIVTVATVAAAMAYRDHRTHTASVLDRVFTENRLKMSSTVEHIEQYLGGVYSDLLFISLDPNVKIMDDGSADHIQAIFDHDWEKLRLSEIYVIERDFDGTHAPFMTFEYGSATYDVEKLHSLEREEEEYQIQIRHIQQFIADPSLKAQLSPEIDLCVDTPDGGAVQGVVFSVPVTLAGELTGIVAGMIPTAKIASTLERVGYANMCILVSEWGDLFGCEELPDETRAWFEDQFSRKGVAAFFAESPEVFEVDKWKTLWAPVDIVSEQRWWLAFQYDEAVYASKAELDRLTHGLGTPAGIMFSGIILALLVRATFRRLEERVGFLRERQRAQDTLHSIVEGTSGTTGDEFFRALVRQLASALGLRFAVVAVLEVPDKTRMRTLAVWSGDDFSEDFEYGLAGTPCEQVELGDMCIYPSGVRESFPKDTLLAEMGVESYMGVPLRDSSEEVLGILVVMDDKPMVETEDRLRTLLTIFGARAAAELERTQAEEAHARLATAIDQAAEAIVITDPGGTIQYVNPAFESITGYSAEEAVGQNPRILKSGKHSDAFYRAMWDTLQRGEVWAGHLVNKRNDGSLFEEQATISPIRNAAGKTTNYVAVKRDVTHEVELETQLRQAQKMEAIGSLAGGIAHDFNNILNAVLGYADLAMQDVPEGSLVHQNLEQVTRAGRRAADLVDQILTFSRQTEQARKPIRIQNVIEETLKLLRGTLPSTIKVRQTIDSGCGPVWADSSQIQQVVMNLCTNAYHAMREMGGVLEVTLDEIDVDAGLAKEEPDLKQARYVRFAVSDTGHGISPSTMQRIFEPYFTTKDVGVGTGLGLATVHGIVRSHKGAVTVESEPGKGTTFTVFLPLSVQEADALEVEEEPEPTTLTGDECILHVDDEEPIARLVETTLGRLGYTVVSRTSSVEALAAFRAEPMRFDVVVTDQTMPNLTGVELAKEMMRIRPDIPIVLCTGFSELVDEKQAKAIGIQAYVKKPIIGHELAMAIRRVLDRAEADTE